MLPENFLNTDRVTISLDIQSKKRLLEHIAEMFAAHHERIQADEVFEKLIERERLGSTGLGQGIALPHARINGLDQAYASFIRLKQGIDFDTIDNSPVDLILALLVPENANEEHLQILAGLARFFSDASNCQQLRETNDTQTLVELIVNGVESAQQVLN